MQTCAVIPAAGMGSRLNVNVPKLLVPLHNQVTPWALLRKKLVPLVDHIHIIIAPKHEALMQMVLQEDIDAGLVSISLQPNPIGMGDAIFCGYPIWSQAKIILIVWGDQVLISRQTLNQCLTIHNGHPHTIVLPLVEMVNPYVEYVFTQDNQLEFIRQSREGDCCSESGLADVGTFVLSVEHLLSFWQTYINQIPYGTQTGEMNFLPFLVYLAQNKWEIRSVSVNNINEAKGLNTPEDLHFINALLSKQGEK